MPNGPDRAKQTPTTPESGHAPAKTEAVVTRDPNAPYEPFTTATLVESLVLQLPLRLFLGGVFVLAGYLKLFHTSDAVSDPVLNFAETIHAYRLPMVNEHDWLISLLAYVIPWAELVAGVMLILGLAPRAAATLLVLMLLAFTGGNLWVIGNGFDTTCSCFGELEWPCGGQVTWCQFWRNCVLLAVGGYLAARGGGIVALQRLFGFRADGSRKRRLGYIVPGQEPA